MWSHHIIQHDNYVLKNIIMDLNNVMQCSHKNIFLEFFMQKNQNILNHYSL